MIRLNLIATGLALLVAGPCTAQGELEMTVNAAIKPVMQAQGITGMAVAVTVKGQTHFFNFGLASRETGIAVTQDTLFETGSLSKTFTATLGAYAAATGKLSLSSKASQVWPALQGSAFDSVSVLQLGTYTAGGLPLQFPAEADHQDAIRGYFKQWAPAYPAGTHRQYSNPSLGLFGFLAAKSMGEPFEQLMEKKLLPDLGLSHTYLSVPKTQMALYAQGYNKEDKPVRVGPGAFAAQAYGVKSSAADLIRFVQVNLQPSALAEPLQQAIAATHRSYYTVGAMHQGLGWESYEYPVALDVLLAGNSSQMASEAREGKRPETPLPPTDNAWFNKTGSTGGFGAYVAFVPAKDIGIVILANRNYPIPERVKMAYAILDALDDQG